MTATLDCPFCQSPMERGQIWIAGKGEWKNYLRIDWAAADKELKNKFFTRSKQAEKTLFSAGRQGMSSPAVEAFHCSSCDALVAHFAHQTSDN
ncbi:MAG: PF20097 family protein [Planctomycetota bacterium]|nr:PF20097 family protein [Planctomycetota bacterium]